MGSGIARLGGFCSEFLVLGKGGTVNSRRLPQLPSVLPAINSMVGLIFVDYIARRINPVSPVNSIHRIIVQAVFVALVLTGCRGELSIDTSATASAEEIDAIRRSQPVDITPEQVAESFSFGGSATDVQRKRVTEALMGSVIEWNFKVYELSLDDGVYRLFSEPLGESSDRSIALLRAVAVITPADENDVTVLESLRLGNSVRLRGRVKDVLMRVIVLVEPAVLVGAAGAASAER